MEISKFSPSSTCLQLGAVAAKSIGGNFSPEAKLAKFSEIKFPIPPGIFVASIIVASCVIY